MITDIIAITSIAAFGIIGAATKFNKPSRRIYSLITAIGITSLIFVIYQTRVNDVEWLSNIDKVLTQMGVVKNFILLSIIISSSLLLSLVLNPFYKLIDVAVASINKPSAIVCGAICGTINCFMLIIAILQICNITNVQIETNIFKSLQMLISQ